jgi:hypothetical protein
MVAPAAPAASADTPGTPAGIGEVNVMIVLLTVIAIVIAGVPLAAVVLVTVASRREDNASSISGRAPGGTERAARRLLAFHATGIGRPACRASARGQRPGSGRSAGDDRRRAGRTDRSGRTDSAGRTDGAGRTSRGGHNGAPGRHDLIGAGLAGPTRRP